MKCFFPPMHERSCAVFLTNLVCRLGLQLFEDLLRLLLRREHSTHFGRGTVCEVGHG